MGAATATRRPVLESKASALPPARPGATTRGVPEMPAWPRSTWARAIRTVIERLLLFPVTRWLCRPLTVTGADRLPPGPVLLVANHASHADTAAVLLALPPRLRSRTAPAAAEDYFFRGRIRSAVVSLLTGAFPFPRRGWLGVDRAGSLLRSDCSVLLFPEGTRSGGQFRCGAGALALEGVPVVPVGIAGTRDVLPKGRRLPRRSPVCVVFGEVLRFEPDMTLEAAAAAIERRVRTLEATGRRGPFGVGHGLPTAPAH